MFWLEDAKLLAILLADIFELPLLGRNDEVIIIHLLVVMAASGMMYYVICGCGQSMVF